MSLLFHFLQLLKHNKADVGIFFFCRAKGTDAPWSTTVLLSTNQKRVFLSGVL